MTDDLDNGIALRVRDLRVRFGDPVRGRVVQAVCGVSFDLKRGRTLAIVGESGSGKSVTAFSILRLIQKPGEIVGGHIWLSDPKGGSPIDLASLAEDSPQLFAVRGGRISMIFQEPMTALSPVHTIGNQVCEALLLHRTRDKREAWRLAVEMLGRVGIIDPERRMKQYPFEFSGGMRQRVVIAMALVCRPQVLLADEPTTALDVTIQAQILELIRELQREMGTSVIFITHDLGVVAQIADDVVVMRRGKIVEAADVRTLFRQPRHPYTRELLSAVSGDMPGEVARGQVT
jgi:ABC-type dipeptide/oligopeptide/nickel transport system ATPase component